MCVDDLARSVAAVVLAAGASSRLGRPKQLEIVDPDTHHLDRRPERLLERAVRLASEAGCAPILVVLGASADIIQAETSLARSQIVINPAWTDGLSASLRFGLRQLDPACPGAVILPCDQPAITATHLRELWSLGLAQGQAIASAYAGRRGIPAYLPASSFVQLTRLQGDSGARDLLSAAESLDLTGGELDVDTEASLAEARVWLRTHR